MTIKIDLFSDTNTNPRAEMRACMANADVGNEAAGEDPTVNLLIEKVLALLGKEAGMFLPSGTMCNGVAYRVFCDRSGDAIILDQTAHPLHKAAGLLGGLVGAVPYTLEGHYGIFTAEQFSELIAAKSKGRNLPRLRVVSIEQTTNLGGGAIWPLEALKEVCKLAHKESICCHMDGARLLNAVVASGISAKEYAAPFDSVWIDFSKGLGAPMGAVLVGSKAFIEEAWYYKFQQGGAMHQAGILAAGCLYALEHNIPRLVEDHEKAKLLASLLSEIPGIVVAPNFPETNILCFKLQHSKANALSLAKELLSQGIRVLAMDPCTMRAITHMDTTLQDIHEVYAAVKRILA